MADPVLPLATLGTEPITNVYSNMKAGVDGDTARVYTLDQMDVDGGLKQNSWDTALRTLSTLNDVFEVGMSDVNMNYHSKGISMPDSIGMRMAAGGASNVHTFPVLDALVADVISGTGRDNDLLGKENAQRMRYINAYYNECKSGVIVEQYGVQYNQVNAYGMYEKATEQLSKFWAEVRGRMVRESLTQWYNTELTSVGTGVAGTGVTQHLNPNWLIPNASADLSTFTDGYGVPIFSSTLQTFQNNIGEALIDAAGTGDGDAKADIFFLDRVSGLATELYIETLDDDTYCAVLPLPQWYRLSGLLANSNSMGEIWQNVSRYANEDMAKFPGEVGSYRDLRIVPDTRYATLKITGATGGDLTFAFGYQQPGGKDGDDRDKSVYDGTETVTDTPDNAVFQIGWLCGKGAYIERKEKDLFFKNEYQEYEKRKGIGSFCETGFNLTVIRTDAATGAAGIPDYPENRGSAVLAFSAISA